MSNLELYFWDGSFNIPFLSVQLSSAPHSEFTAFNIHSIADDASLSLYTSVRGMVEKGRHIRVSIWLAHLQNRNKIWSACYMPMQYSHTSTLSLSPDAIYSTLAICANLFTSSSLLTVIRSILVIKPLNHVNNISLSLARTHTFTHNPLSVILSLVSSYLSHRPIIVFLIYRLSFNRTKHRVDNHRHETYQQQQNIYARRIHSTKIFFN